MKRNYAAFLSILCAIHCLITPFIISLLPLAGKSFLVHPLVELTLTVLSSGLCILVIYSDAKKYHGRYVLMVPVGIGISLFAVNHFYFNDENFWVSITGSVFILSALSINWILHRRHHPH